MKTSYKYCAECRCLHDADQWPHQEEAAEPKYDPSANYDEYMHGPRFGRFKRCAVCGELHEMSNWPHNHMPEPEERSELAAPFIISDNLEAQAGLNGLVSMADGKRYTSKSELRKGYRRAGVEEVGNDSSLKTHVTERKVAPEKTDREIDADITEAIAKAHAELTTDMLSDDSMKTWLRPENAPTDNGFSVGG
jgi:hypothetical protein